MNIKRKDLMHKNSFLQSLILSGLEKTLSKDEFKDFQSDWQSKDEINIKFIVNGVELNLESFIENWQNQVESLIDKKVDEKINELVHVKEYDFEIASKKFIGKSKEQCYKLLWTWLKNDYINCDQFLELVEELEIMEHQNQLSKE